MGAVDDVDALQTLDTWLTLGHGEARCWQAIIQQCWERTALEQITVAWMKATGQHPGDGPIQRGHGWRIWCTNGAVYTSESHAWTEIPDTIILAVSYVGTQRWMAQGVDPYWLSTDGLVHDSRTTYPDGHENPRWQHLVDSPRRMGVYVTDEVMQRTRWHATLAFTL